MMEAGDLITAKEADAALFSNTPGDALRPPGLLVGVTPLPASASTSKAEAMGDDLAALAGAIASFTGNGSIVYVMNPAQAARVLLSAVQAPVVLQSASVAAGSVIAVASAGLASAIEAPRLDAGKSVSVHSETVPQPVGTSSPGRSFFQTDTVALRLILGATWAVRDPRAVAVVSGVKW
jgi:hypothetical protein